MLSRCEKNISHSQLTIHSYGTQEGLLRQKNQLDAYVAWHRQQGLAPTLEEMMEMPSTNERWSQVGATGNQKGAPKVTVILNLFMREVRERASNSSRDDGVACSCSKYGITIRWHYDIICARDVVAEHFSVDEWGTGIVRGRSALGSRTIGRVKGTLVLNVKKDS